VPESLGDGARVDSFLWTRKTMREMQTTTGLPNPHGESTS